MIFTTNNIKLPEYVNEMYLMKCVQNAIGSSNFKIFEAITTTGSKAGENFCSDIFRMQVKYEKTDRKLHESLNIIIKHLGYKTERDTFFTHLKVYEKECNMYFEIIPAISELLCNEMFAPRCYYATDNPIQSIVLQDMNPEGYRIGNQEYGLDEHHSKLLLKKLGKYHAASMILLENNPQLKMKFSTGMLHPDAMNEPLHAQLFHGGIKAVADVARNWENSSRIREKLLQIYDNFFENISKVTDTHNDRIKVLNHGDCWVNNILFKFDGEKNAKDVAFIDFQMSVYASPGLDINYFLHTSPQLDVIKHQREDLIFTYCKSLRDTLEQLKYHTIPTLSEIKEEIRRKEFYGLIAAASILPLIKMDRGAATESNLDSFFDEEQTEKARLAMYTSKQYSEFMKYFLQRFNDLGVLDSYNL